MKYEELLKTFEYIFNADSTSVYPASMAGFKLLEVKYPVGNQDFQNILKKNLIRENVDYMKYFLDVLKI